MKSGEYVSKYELIEEGGSQLVIGLTQFINSEIRIAFRPVKLCLVHYDSVVASDTWENLEGVPPTK
jgi:hypothetical protein